MVKGRILEDAIAAASNRRSFMTKIAVASAGAAALGSGLMQGQTSAPTDADILNFALNLEYLEAEFYTVATTGLTIDQMGISITGSGTQGAATGGQKVNLTNSMFPTLAIANEIANDERSHVTLIQQALTAAGAQPIAQPAINLNALGIGFGSLAEFLTLARAFEDIGVSAYAGAAPLISELGYPRLCRAHLGGRGRARFQHSPSGGSAWRFHHTFGRRRHSAAALRTELFLAEQRGPGRNPNAGTGVVYRLRFHGECYVGRILSQRSEWNHQYFDGRSIDQQHYERSCNSYQPDYESVVRHAECQCIDQRRRKSKIFVYGCTWRLTSGFAADAD